MSGNQESKKKSSKSSKSSKTTQYEKQIFDLQQMLEISRSLSTTLEYSNLIESIIYISMAQMRVTGAGLLIHEGVDSSEFVLGNYYKGLELDETFDYKISVNSSFITYLSNPEKSNHAYTLKELKTELKDNCDLEMLATLNPTLIVPMVAKNHLNGLLLLGERIVVDENGGKYSEYERNEICTIASLASIAVNTASLIERSSTDSMTKLKQKYYFFNVLSDRLDFASQKKQSVSVLMFDIDFFKRFNDNYGHSCGDYVLCTVAQIMKDSIRAEDLASRYGGEEFTIMLYNASKKESMAIAERIRTNIQNYDFCYKDQHMSVTISGGVSIYSLDNNPVNSAKTLVDQADQALYVSKRNGRNQVTFADLALLAAIDLETTER